VEERTDDAAPRMNIRTNLRRVQRRCVDGNRRFFVDGA
jgi:hypothetical protein